MRNEGTGRELTGSVSCGARPAHFPEKGSESRAEAKRARPRMDGRGTADRLWRGGRTMRAGDSEKSMRAVGDIRSRPGVIRSGARAVAAFLRFGSASRALGRRRGRPSLRRTLENLG